VGEGAWEVVAAAEVETWGVSGSWATGPVVGSVVAIVLVFKRVSESTGTGSSEPRGSEPGMFCDMIDRVLDIC
jgi:hypothetical protein